MQNLLLSWHFCACMFHPHFPQQFFFGLFCNIFSIFFSPRHAAISQKLWQRRWFAFLKLTFHIYVFAENKPPVSRVGAWIRLHINAIWYVWIWFGWIQTSSSINTYHSSQPRFEVWKYTLPQETGNLGAGFSTSHEQCFRQDILSKRRKCFSIMNWNLRLAKLQW